MDDDNDGHQVMAIAHMAFSSKAKNYNKKRNKDKNKNNTHTKNT